MKYLSTVSICFLCYSNITLGNLGVHIVGSNSVQSADRARALLNSNEKDNSQGDSLLDMLDTQTLGGTGIKNSDNTYNSSGGTARIDKYLGDSSLIGMSLGGIYTEVEGDTQQSQDITVMTNFYGATKSDSLGAFVDFSYANFLGSSSTFGSRAISTLGGVALNIETDTAGLSYSPILMLNSLYLQDPANMENASYNGLKMMLGVELDYQINKNYTATLKGLYGYEFKDTANAYNYNDFTGSYTSLGEVGNKSMQVGAGLNYNFNDTISAGFDYSIYFYDTFISKNINLKLDFSF